MEELNGTSGCRLVRVKEERIRRKWVKGLKADIERHEIVIIAGEALEACGFRNPALAKKAISRTKYSLASVQSKLPRPSRYFGNCPRGCPVGAKASP